MGADVAPKSSGYKEMSSAVIDKVLKYNTGPVDPGYPQGLNVFCADAAKQKDHDPNSGSIARSYSIGDRYGVRFGIDWPQRLDISDNMEASVNRCPCFPGLPRTNVTVQAAAAMIRTIP